jgi:Uma2 family endonuclease
VPEGGYAAEALGQSTCCVARAVQFGGFGADPRLRRRCGTPAALPSSFCYSEGRQPQPGGAGDSPAVVPRARTRWQANRLPHPATVAGFLFLVMQTDESISVREYLTTSYDPDCDYVDGVVEERNVGERDHARLQGAVFAYLYNHRKEWGIHVYPEQRVQVSPARFRVPDVCVVVGPEPPEQIFRTPPFICIEILSPEDRLSKMRERVDDYLAFGVSYVWLLDPQTRRAYRCTEQGMLEVKELRTAQPEIVVPLEALFE